MPLLLIDMLGTKSRWQEGRAAVGTAFARFDEFVLDGLQASTATPIAGGVDSDAAAFVFDDAADLFRVARRIYLNAFNCETEGGRYWLRGVVVPYAGEGLRESVNLGPPYGHLTRTTHSPPLLDSIAVEQSGRIKGMRLVVSSAIVDAHLTSTFRLQLEVGKFLHPFKHLDFSGYPEPLNGSEWQDYLWMATDDRGVWLTRVRSIRDKMRKSSVSEAETAHAAATRVVFDQCRAIMGSVKVDWA